MRISITGAKALTTKEKGVFASFFTGLINESSFATMVIPSAGQKSSPTARTASINFAPSLPSGKCPAQFKESRTSDSAPMLAAAILVIASPMAIRAQAEKSMRESAGRSPKLMASP